MGLERFKKECPGVAGSIQRLFGEAVVEAIAHDYCLVADHGGNEEYGVQREDGVSFNPRIARLLSLFIQECAPVNVRMLRVAAYASLPADAREAAVVPADLASDVAQVHAPCETSPMWIRGLSLALVLDRVRHLHMSNLSDEAKRDFLETAERDVEAWGGGASPVAIAQKVAHGIGLQRRRLSVEGGNDGQRGCCGG